MAVVKIIELVGSSKTSTDDAAKQALQQAQGSLRNIRAVDIVSTGIRGENLDEYRAHVRVTEGQSFRLAHATTGKAVAHCPAGQLGEISCPFLGSFMDASEEIFRPSVGRTT